MWFEKLTTNGREDSRRFQRETTTNCTFLSALPFVRLRIDQAVARAGAVLFRRFRELQEIGCRHFDGDPIRGAEKGRAFDTLNCRIYSRNFRRKAPFCAVPQPLMAGEPRQCEGLVNGDAKNCFHSVATGHHKFPRNPQKLFFEADYGDWFVMQYTKLIYATPASLGDDKVLHTQLALTRLSTTLFPL